MCGLQLRRTIFKKNPVLKTQLKLLSNRRFICVADRNVKIFFLSFINTFTSCFHEILFLLCQAGRIDKVFIPQKREGYFLLCLLQSKKFRLHEKFVWQINFVCLNVRYVWIIRIAQKNITITFCDCNTRNSSDQTPVDMTVSSSCCFSLFELGIQGKEIHGRTALCQKPTTRRLQVGSTARDHGCHIAQSRCLLKLFWAQCKQYHHLFNAFKMSRFLQRFLSDSFRDFPQFLTKYSFFDTEADVAQLSFLRCYLQWWVDDRL